MTLRWTVILGVVCMAGWLFIHNSGYGYDALEYLVIGRSLLDGHPFYTFVPSKSWALYYLVAMYLRLPLAGTHWGVSLLIALLDGVAAVLTYRIVARVFDRRTAIVATAFVGLAMLFTELNYLEPESLVYAAGLLAFIAVSRDRRRTRAWFLAGLWIGIGMAFKSTAGLYAIAMALSLVTGDGDAEAPGWTSSLARGAAFGAGVMAAMAIPAAYFLATGRLGAHVQWSYVFPLWFYPASDTWAIKLMVKLLPFWVLVAAGVVTSVHPHVRQIYRNPSAVLALLMGVTSSIALLKTQASHYAFPALAFLLIFAAVAFSKAIARWQPSRRFQITLAMSVLLLCATAGLLYRRGAVARLTTIRAFDDETTMRDRIDALVPADKHAIFLTRGTALYWLSRRYPAWPVLNTDVQTTYLVDRTPASLLAALDDPDLLLVEYDPRMTTFDDERFGTSAAGRHFLSRVACELGAKYDRRDDLIPPLVLWTRKATRAERQPSTACLQASSAGAQTLVEGS